MPKALVRLDPACGPVANEAFGRIGIETEMIFLWHAGLVSANASETEPVKILAVSVIDNDETQLTNLTKNASCLQLLPSNRAAKMARSR
ncbi:hypothetical protein FHS21_003635 [Phyllobacterium trifolii]|uniref:Uncharacterized protein n=1 Tax=Phyllobacterium trifolii TaxID=300193 RepID=A0A839UFF5_9HYPH|nr:hypothetical protein [Phyllobacterium trifolii]